MNVLSLFDGISCGRVALDRAGIHVSNYFASEIDKHAIAISRKNWPDIVQLGDVTKISDWYVENLLPPIDMIIAGSPCQGFSFAGKQLNFNDPRSALFFDFVRIWKACKRRNPNCKFFLENVPMKSEYRDVITQYMGVCPVLINSALVSAQNRKRLYWSDLCPIVQPADKGIYLKDILESGKAYRYKSRCLRVGGYNSPAGSRQEWSLATVDRHFTPIEMERLQGLPDNYTSGICDTQKRKALGNGWQVDTITHIFSQSQIIQ